MRERAWLHHSGCSDAGPESGPELQTRLVQRGSTLPILFITGYPDVPTIVSTVKAGAEDFLTKPINSQQLLQAVEGAIAHHKASSEVNAKLGQRLMQKMAVQSLAELVS